MIILAVVNHEANAHFYYNLFLLQALFQLQTINQLSHNIHRNALKINTLNIKIKIFLCCLSKCLHYCCL
ncbi:hypothetical protein CWB78_01570 [Pseudoalteromonas sp. S1612]|nr:hypothetical protein CWB78_01570 [Pseudoalteromonas sp. S1612]